MILLAIPVAIIKGAFLVIKYILSNRILLVIGVVAIAAIIIMGRINHNTIQQQSNIPVYQQIVPTYQQAPLVIQTDSRIFYVAEYQDDGPTVILDKYYYYDKNNWQYVAKPLILDRQLVNLKIYERRGAY